MNINQIPLTKKALLTKTFQKILEKLFAHYKEGRIGKEEMIEKLEKVQKILERTTNSINDADKKIKERKEYNKLEDFLILEHLFYNNYVKTAELFVNKRNTLNDKDFFDEISENQNKIRRGEVKDVLQFVKDNKIHYKEGFSDIEHKLKVLEFNKISKKDKYEGMEYAQDTFKKEKKPVRDYLMVLVNGKDNIEISTITNNFRMCMLKMYNLEDRFAQILEIGLIAQKTAVCSKHKNVECAGCVFYNFTKLYNRIETSEILCEGTGKILDSSNQAFSDSDGKVYGKEYLGDANLCIDGPKTCFFV